MLYGLEKFPKRDTFHSKFMNGFTGWDIMEDFPVHDRSGRVRSSYPAVNILEYDKDYKIELAAPGLCKKDYEITLEKDMLKITNIKRFDNEDDADKYARREFAHREFEKVFILPENADIENISASCADGILNIHIPKKVIDTKRTSRMIPIK
jgi:HSP20 family protein